MLASNCCSFFLNLQRVMSIGVNYHAWLWFMITFLLPFIQVFVKYLYMSSLLVTCLIIPICLGSLCLLRTLLPFSLSKGRLAGPKNPVPMKLKSSVQRQQHKAMGVTIVFWNELWFLQKKKCFPPLWLHECVKPSAVPTNPHSTQKQSHLEPKCDIIEKKSWQRKSEILLIFPTEWAQTRRSETSVFFS